MLYRLSWVFLLGAMLAVAGCVTKDLPETTLGTPDFFVRGTLSGQPLTLSAGTDTYFMHTKYDAVEPGLWRYHGYLAPDGCIDCPGAFGIIVRDFRLHEEQTPTNIDSALRFSRYLYYKQNGIEQEIFRVSFQNDRTDEDGEYLWSFGDGDTSMGPNPIHDYTDPNAEFYTVCLESFDASGCNTSICNEVFVQDTTCQLDFVHELVEGSSYVRFSAKVQGVPPYRYRWDFGDGFGSSLGNPGYTYAQPGLYTVCVTVTDATGCEQSLCKNIAADPTFCEKGNFSYKVERTQLLDTLQFSRVSLIWYDEEGTLYGSSLGDQPSSSFFELVDQADFDANERGDAVKQVSLRFRARLYSREGETIDLSSDDAQLGIAYP